MSDTRPSGVRALTAEVALLLMLVFVGLTLLPLLIYAIGSSLFGSYGVSGFSGFYATIHSEMRNGEAAAWLLVLSPYIVWQTLRLTVRGFRWASRGRPHIPS